MALSALVIGHGSIGKRHAEVLTGIDEIGDVSVLSSQPGLPYQTLSSLEEIPRLDPDYIVVASPTTQHHSQLDFLEEHLQDKKILVEKPLFDSLVDFQVRNNEMVVGYNLRFHPLLQKIRELCRDRHLWSILVFCCTYLPDWRPGRDYRTSSSARKDSGGGVLLDLSHELDYVQWLAGPLETEHAVSKKVSDLEIDTDDLLLFSGRSAGGACVHIGLNYFTREPIRQIILDGEDISIQGDLISKKLVVTMGGSKSEFSWPDLERNQTYRAMHLAVLSDDYSDICKFDQGLQTMALIESIRSWPKR